MSSLIPAPKGYPIKLVRDRTAAIINHTGRPGALFYAPIPAPQRARWLRRKLIEEAAEYLESAELDELVDVLAVVAGLATTHGLELSQLAERMRADERGGFLNGQMMYGHHPEFDG
jgi:predicted house-cleaning noncanonical NTP pyrophosphatase (MazG superfamily)